MKNPWRPFTESWETVREGIVLLSKSGEFRMKRYPTVDVQCEDGIWAVTEQGIREKPRNKRGGGINRLTAMRYLSAYLPLTMCEQGQFENYLVSYGAFTSMEVRGNVLCLPSQEMPIKEEIRDDIKIIKFNDRAIAFPKDEKIKDHYKYYNERKLGVKAVVLIGDSKKPYVFKDGSKKWDMIGGTIEPTDWGSAKALLREWHEEVGEECKGELEYIGRSSDGGYTTFLYEVKLREKPPGQWTIYTGDLFMVPWLPRLIQRWLRGRGEQNNRVTDRMVLTERGIDLVMQVRQRKLRGGSTTRYEELLLSIFNIYETDQSYENKIIETSRHIKLHEEDELRTLRDLNGLWGGETGD